MQNLIADDMQLMAPRFCTQAKYPVVRNRDWRPIRQSNCYSPSYSHDTSTRDAGQVLCTDSKISGGWWMPYQILTKQMCYWAGRSYWRSIRIQHLRLAACAQMGVDVCMLLVVPWCTAGPAG